MKLSQIKNFLSSHSRIVVVVIVVIGVGALAYAGSMQANKGKDLNEKTEAAMNLIYKVAHNELGNVECTYKTRVKETPQTSQAPQSVKVSNSSQPSQYKAQFTSGDKYHLESSNDKGKWLVVVKDGTVYFWKQGDKKGLKAAFTNRVVEFEKQFGSLKPENIKKGYENAKVDDLACHDGANIDQSLYTIPKEVVFSEVPTTKKPAPLK